MGACDDRDATSDANVSIDRAATRARLSRATRGRWMMHLAPPRPRGGRIPGKARSSARRARASRRRERRSARARRSRRSRSTHRRSSRAPRSLATRVARGKIQGAPSCESPKPDRARIRRPGHRRRRDGEGGPRERRCERRQILARAFPSRKMIASTDRSRSCSLAQSTSDATNSESAPSKS